MNGMAEHQSLEQLFWVPATTKGKSSLSETSCVTARGRKIPAAVGMVWLRAAWLQGAAGGFAGISPQSPLWCLPSESSKHPVPRAAPCLLEAQGSGQPGSATAPADPVWMDMQLFFPSKTSAFHTSRCSGSGITPTYGEALHRSRSVNALGGRFSETSLDTRSSVSANAVLLPS